MLTVNAVEDCKTHIWYSDIKLAAEIVAAAGDKQIKTGDELGIKLSEGIPSEVFQVTKVIVTTYQDKELKAIVAKNSRSTVFAFRGTRGAAQLGQQLNSALKHKKELTFGGGTVKVMKFFWGAFETFLPELQEYFTGGEWKYIVAGHSLGGAMASLLAIYMKNNTEVALDPPSALITFGAPRVGNEAYAQVHDSMIPPSRKARIVNGHDPVPHIPLKSVGYRYKHHSREIWFGTDATTTVKFLKVCDEMDPNDCSNGNKANLAVGDHPMEVYRTLVDTPRFVFRDKAGRPVISFEQALISSCTKSVS